MQQNSGLAAPKSESSLWANSGISGVVTHFNAGSILLALKANLRADIYTGLYRMATIRPLHILKNIKMVTQVTVFK